MKEKIIKLLKIVDDLREKYKRYNKEFTLDGRLVGDLGEVIVSENYKLKLFTKLKKDFDAETSDKKLVQIKTTMKDSLTYKHNSKNGYYIGIKINKDGTFKEIYNGPMKNIYKVMKNGKEPDNKLHNISIKVLTNLNNLVESKSKIEKIKQ